MNFISAIPPVSFFHHNSFYSFICYLKWNHQFFTILHDDTCRFPLLLYLGFSYQAVFTTALTRGYFSSIQTPYHNHLFERTHMVNKFKVTADRILDFWNMYCDWEMFCIATERCLTISLDIVYNSFTFTTASGANFNINKPLKQMQMEPVMSRNYSILMNRHRSESTKNKAPVMQMYISVN